MRVLMVEDDSDLVDLMTYALTREGYNVSAAPDGEQGLIRFRDEKPDLLLIDVSLAHAPTLRSSSSTLASMRRRAASVS